MSIKFEGKKYSDFVSGMSEASSPADDDYGTLVGSTKGSRKFKAADIGKSIFSISNGKCVAHLPSLVGGQIVFTYRINSVDGGTTMVQGIAFATFTNTSSKTFKKIDYIQNFNGPFPFVLENDGTRTAIVYSYGNKNAIDINVLSKDRDWVIDLDGSFPDGWDSSAATDIGTYNLMCQPQWETDFLKEYVDGRATNSKLSHMVDNGKCVAYFSGTNGAYAIFSYRFLEQKGSSYYNTAGIAVATVYGNGGSDSGTCKIDFLNGYNAISAEYPFKFYKSGSYLAIENVSGHTADVEVFGFKSSFTLSEDGSFPSDWDSTTATEVGSYHRNATSEDVAALENEIAGVPIPTSTIFELVGNGTTACQVYNKVFPNTDYTVEIDNPNWEYPSGSYYRYFIALHYADGSSSDIYKVEASSKYSVQKSFSFNSGNAERVRVFFRGNVGVTVKAKLTIDTESSKKDSENYLINAVTRARKSGTSSRDFAFGISTDTHSNDAALTEVINFVCGNSQLPCVIHCGDYVSDTIDLNNLTSTFATIVGDSSKPVYFVMGNHEKGNYKNLRYTPTDSHLYNLYIKPIVDNGWLASGEYTENKCYYFHDFATEKTRLIVIDEYEAPMDFDNSYWQQIAYNSSYANISDSTAYAVGDCVNVPGYTDYSFACVTTCTPTSYASGKHPCYKCRRGYRYISQMQAQWFLNTLANTPAGYQVVVACHNPYSDIAENQPSMKFNLNLSKVGADEAQNYLATDFIAEAINAFVKKSNFTISVSTKVGSEAAYIGAYTVSKDFSSSASNAFRCLIGGHVHKDEIWRHPTYKNQYQITPTSAYVAYYQSYVNSDIRLTEGEYSYTCVGVAENRIALCKIGNNISDDGYIRDIEVWNPNA